MLNNFLNFIKKNDLFKEGDRILLAISGGIDSIVMCHLFNKAKIPFGIAHCNFQLRGDESDKDEVWVQELAKKYDVPFFVKHFNVKKYQESEKKSTQMAARKLRYKWFEELINKHAYSFVATAHHQSDAIETMLLNLTKGTSLSGLAGIPVKNNHIIRPLMFTNRSIIKKYALKNELTWKEDSSNLLNDYQRNYIRNIIIPALKKINPNFEDSAKRSITYLKEASTCIDDKVNKLRKTLLHTKNNEILINKRNTPEEEIIWYELLKPYGFNTSQIAQIRKNKGAQSGKVYLSPTHQLIIDREYLIISKKEKDTFKSIFIEENHHILANPHIHLSLNYINKKDWQLSNDPNIAALDAEKLVYPLMIRQWEAGDFFYPIGMKHKKKLSDFLIDQKIPVNLKKIIFVLTSENNIVWVVGMRLDDRYKITENTHKILLIEKKDHD